MATQSGSKIRLGFRQSLKLILPYVWSKMLEQVKSVWLIIIYLVIFLRFFLNLPVADAAMIAVGLGLVVAGLSFFMEGLVLGLMPLGEVIGLKLPQKSSLPAILVFSLLLGLGATFAEPAVGVLKAAGSSVQAWSAPLLFTVLNRQADLLVYAVGIGVGVAVMCGMVRFMYNLSLKPFIYALAGGLAVLTLAASLDKNLASFIGLAWDCGGVTTGPVTVPLVLALGIGVCRVLGRGGSGDGFGVVTLASLFPVLAVLLLGFALNFNAPQPMDENSFFNRDNRAQTLSLFRDREGLIGYAFKNTDVDNQAALFDGGPAEMLAYLRHLAEDEAARQKVFGSDPEALRRWAIQQGTPEQRLAVFGSEERIGEAATQYSMAPVRIDYRDLMKRNGLAAAQAIIPLSLFLLVVLVVLLRERLPRTDEVILGLVLALVGMMVFSSGIEIGLGRLGNQVGGRLPSLFKNIELTDQYRTIADFDREAVLTALTPDGVKSRFFYRHYHGGFEAIPFIESGYDQVTGAYTYTPTKGPIFQDRLIGIVVLLVFAFFMGYGATLAEPALNALGRTVEELTVGTFKKSYLMQAVAIGVGAGIALGMAKIVWGLPLAWMLAPSYLLLLVLTRLSSEEFVNIAWDSAGVTTGPVTVPLVLAMGLGIGGQVGVIEGFGILAMASVCPIMVVLLVGFSVRRERIEAI
jgi:hypothetical protein